MSAEGVPPSDRGQDARDTQDQCFSVMAGGDFALIKSVEGFEDFPDFGRRQLQEVGVQQDDVVVAITEGGETPFVIGTAWQGLDAGAHVFFVYNNPSDLLRRHVQRSREVLEEPRIHKLDLATGPMAITGSTRMQATTTELLVVGAALETAIAQFLQEASPRSHADASVGMAPVFDTPQEYRERFRRLLDQVARPAAVAAIARLVELEEQIYRRHGLVTYVADAWLLDILTDTTERAPTFMLPPFRKEGDTIAPVSWAFVKSSLSRDASGVGRPAATGAPRPDLGSGSLPAVAVPRCRCKPTRRSSTTTRSTSSASATSPTPREPMPPIQCSCSSAVSPVHPSLICRSSIPADRRDHVRA